jgi:hypothetical protein
MLEGFQTIDISSLDYLKTCPAAQDPRCEKRTIGTGTDETNVYVCRGIDSQEKAENILDCSPDYVTTQLQNAPDPFLKLTDGVCYEVYNTKVQGQTYYVCYERPPAIIYDPSTQDLNFNDAKMDGDPVPLAMMNNLPIACSLYGGNSAILARSYTSTLANYRYVTSSITTMENVYSTITGLKTTYCTTKRNQGQSNACDALNAFGTASGDANLANLNRIQNDLSNGVTNMSNFYMNVLQPSYTGMNCQTPAIRMPF